MTHRAITNDDLNSAIRGLGMLGMPPSELDKLIEQHMPSDMFASRVIVMAAKHVAATKRFNGASG